MTFNEYYGFPEGTNVTQRYMLSSWYDFPTAQLPVDCTYLFARNKAPYLCPWDTSKVTDMESIFDNASMVDLKGAENWDTSNVTDMRSMFSYCKNLTDISALKNWDTSNVTLMSSMFNYCNTIVEIDLSNWDTSKVNTMDAMLTYTDALTTFGPIDCSSVTKNNYPLNTYSKNSKLVNLGGFLNMKSSWDENYGLAQYQSLTYESCINILNGLYDFTGNGETPKSDQGKLKVNANFLTTVGDEITIGTNKGWTITA